jgi:HK97 family phage prohead protease
MIKYGAPLPIVETKARDDAWEVTGYVATYNDLDLGNDVILPGAFDRWLASGGKTRFLYSHRPDKVLGVFTELKSDKRGLLARGRISKTPLGEEVYTLVKDGAVDSFSIGYVTMDSDTDDGIRRLKDLDLPESSLVAIPMNPQATVTAWKDWLSAFGTEQADDPPPHTLAQRAEQIKQALEQFLNDTRALTENGRDLNQKKRDELTQLLEMFSGLDDVRSGVTALVNFQPHGDAEAKRLFFELSESRKRLSHILGA